MKQFHPLAAFAALALSILPASAMDVATAQGTVAVDGVPKTIAVYDMAALDTLDRLGIRPAGVPDKLYVPELEPIKAGATVVGTLFEPDLEALSALGPDLVIVGGRSAAKADVTAKVAPTIDMTIDGDDLFGQAKLRLETYGDLFGEVEEAKAIAGELDAKLAAAKAAVAGKGTALIVMTNGPKVSSYGPGSRFGWVHAALGLPPAIAEIETATHGEAVSFEFIREANPDWLLVLDRAAAIGSSEQAAKVTLDNELVAATTAWKKGQVVYLPAPDFYIAAGGVQSLERVLATITEAFSAAK
ncbi:siderophore ABC transporter substrate-binding protein [Shinella granuli]|uniref:Iron complex transport system substrate-binding protein n=1 Tax=Shinella granuli TaxID=323621 RepID=A0A4R2CWB2_SHIGR|nr:siderophore ABC transporter substrate-binding protein [Shinella granuli]TCN45958.1 iron complex transport system substrate-binding protein [Shinella granuli]